MLTGFGAVVHAAGRTSAARRDRFPSLSLSGSLGVEALALLGVLFLCRPPADGAPPGDVPRGEHGAYVVSDGTNRPVRVKMRAPSFYACQGLPKLIIGGLIADVIAVIGSTDVVMGDVDR